MRIGKGPPASSVGSDGKLRKAYKEEVDEVRARIIIGTPKRSPICEKGLRNLYIRNVRRQISSLSTPFAVFFNVLRGQFISCR